MVVSLRRIHTLFNAFLFFSRCLSILSISWSVSLRQMQKWVHAHTYASMCTCTHAARCIFLLMPRIKRMFFRSIRMFVPASVREGMLSDGSLPRGARNQLDEGEPGPLRDAEDTNTHNVTRAVTNRNACTHTHRAHRHTCTGTGTCVRIRTVRHEHMHGDTHKLQGLRECVRELERVGCYLFISLSCSQEATSPRSCKHTETQDSVSSNPGNNKWSPHTSMHTHMWDACTNTHTHMRGVSALTAKTRQHPP